MYSKDFAFWAESGLTPEQLRGAQAAASLIVSAGDQEELIRMVFNQVVNLCKKHGIDYHPILRALRDDLNERLDGPQTAGEFYAPYGDDDQG